MIIRTTPSEWNSVHRPIVHVYDHEVRTVTAVGNTGGFAAFGVSPAFDFTPAAGDKVKVLSGDYEGLHTVSSYSAPFIITTTPYAGNDPGADILFIRLPEIKLYSGYLPLEEYSTELPITLVATFTPENSPHNDVRIDVSEYLKSIFRILPPVEGIDFNMFNRFRLYFDGAYQDFYMVLNSSIKTGELNELYVNTGAYLNSQIPPIVFGCGKTILSTLQGSVVVNTVTDDADLVGIGDYSGDDYDGADYFIE